MLLDNSAGYPVATESTAGRIWERKNPPNTVAHLIQSPPMEDATNTIMTISLVPPPRTFVLLEQHLVCFPCLPITKREHTSFPPLVQTWSTWSKDRQCGDSAAKWQFTLLLLFLMLFWSSNAVSGKWKWKLLCSCQNNNGYCVGNYSPALHNCMNKRNWEKPILE